MPPSLKSLKSFFGSQPKKPELSFRKLTPPPGKLRKDIDPRIGSLRPKSSMKDRPANFNPTPKPVHTNPTGILPGRVSPNPAGSIASKVSTRIVPPVGAPKRPPLHNMSVGVNKPPSAPAKSMVGREVSTGSPGVLMNASQARASGGKVVSHEGNKVKVLHADGVTRTHDRSEVSPVIFSREEKAQRLASERKAQEIEAARQRAKPMPAAYASTKLTTSTPPLTSKPKFNPTEAERVQHQRDLASAQKHAADLAAKGKVDVFRAGDELTKFGVDRDEARKIASKAIEDEKRRRMGMPPKTTAKIPTEKATPQQIKALVERKSGAPYLGQKIGFDKREQPIKGIKVGAPRKSETSARPLGWDPKTGKVDASNARYEAKALQDEYVKHNRELAQLRDTANNLWGANQEGIAKARREVEEKMLKARERLNATKTKLPKPTKWGW